MLTRTIPRTGEAIPAIGMGTWRTFDVGEDEAGERKRLAAALKTFFAAGARLIDSSPMYGRSERVVGDLIAEGGLQGSAFLATKVWTHGREAGEAQMRESFRLMRTERMDLMQVHNLLDVETHLRMLASWKAAGRIRYVGVTHYHVGAFDEIERLMRSGQIDFVQIPYSVQVRAAEERLLPLARELGIGVVVMRPFEGGTLAQAIRPLPPVAEELGCRSWPELLLKFILAHPAVTCVIPATCRPEHEAEDVRALEGPLPDANQRRRIIEAVEG